jgi:hypothetical protein
MGGEIDLALVGGLFDVAIYQGRVYRSFVARHTRTGTLRRHNLALGRWLMTDKPDGKRRRWDQANLLLSAILLLTGMLTLYRSQDLMTWLIWVVGEEKALGAQNVIREPGGAVLLTNPRAMMFWAIPFFLLGILQLLTGIAGITILCLRSRRPS